MDDGRSVPAWAGRRKVEALKRVKALGRARRPPSPCCICEQPINYALEYPHPQSCSVQHLKSRATHPHLTWEPSNWAPAHLDCNKAAGAREVTGLGVTSVEW